MLRDGEVADFTMCNPPFFDVDETPHAHPAGRGGLLAAAAPAVKKCLEFRKRGKCSRGDACPFAHVAREKAPAPPRETAAGPKRCFTWAKKGKCRKGERCKYAHT